MLKFYFYVIDFYAQKFVLTKFSCTWTLQHLKRTFLHLSPNYCAIEVGVRELGIAYQ